MAWGVISFLPPAIRAALPGRTFSRRKMMRVTPIMVGINCRVLRIKYASIETPQSENNFDIVENIPFISHRARRGH
jgi:hypothetical protein